MATKNGHQTGVRYLYVCEKCEAVNSFGQYKRRGNKVYGKCACGQTITIMEVVYMRGIKAKT